MNYSDWREPMTKAFSCNYKPGDYQIDNSVLFTSEAYMLGLICEDELISILTPFELYPGAFLRHPTSKDFCSYDDPLGASVASPHFAKRVLRYMESQGWTLPNGNWIGRIPIFKPAVRAGAGRKLSWLDQIIVAAVYLHNSFEGREHTSGKCMLYFGRRVFQKHWLTRAAIAYWNRKMEKLYGTPVAMITIYFPMKEGNVHPFCAHAPKEF